MIECTESSTNHSWKWIWLTKAIYKKSAKEFDTEFAK